MCAKWGHILSLCSLLPQALLLPHLLCRPPVLHIPPSQCRNVLAPGPHTSMPTGWWGEDAPTTGSVWKWLGCGVVVKAQGSGKRPPWCESWLYNFSAVCPSYSISYVTGRESLTTVPISVETELVNTHEMLATVPIQKQMLAALIK